MKKILMIAIFGASLQLVHAQDLKKVQTVFLLKKFDDAKTEIDKVMADPKQNTKPEAIYWKSRIYAELYKDTTLRAKYPAVQNDAEQALRNYIAADPGYVQVKEKGAEPFFDMHASRFLDGVKSFNKKNWPQAASDFKAAVDFSDIMFGQKWANTAMAFDTTSVLYLAYAYQNAGKPADAVKVYQRLADAKVVTIGGETNQDAYKYIANYYLTQKDEANFKKYVALGKQLYPNFPADEFEIDFMDSNYTLEQKAKMYQEEDAAGGMSEQKYLTFGDMFVHAKDKEKLDSTQIVAYNLKAADAFKKAYAKNNQNAIAAFNVGVIYYNVYSAYDDRIMYNVRAMRAINAENAEKPAEKDPKKKAAAEAALKAKLEPFKTANAELDKPMLENLDISLEWLEKTYNVLKDKANRSNTEKNILSKSVDFLANLYQYKRDKFRGKDAKLFDEYDAKYKLYDGLHGKM